MQEAQDTADSVQGTSGSDTPNEQSKPPTQAPPEVAEGDNPDAVKQVPGTAEETEIQVTAPEEPEKAKPEEVAEGEQKTESWAMRAPAMSFLVTASQQCLMCQAGSDCTGLSRCRTCQELSANHRHGQQGISVHISDNSSWMPPLSAQYTRSCSGCLLLIV